MKKIILDISTSSIFANASKFVELIGAYHKDNFKIFLIKKNWNKFKFKGVTYDKENNGYTKSTGNYIWDPAIHPKDFFENLVFPSFNQLIFINEISFIKKILYIFKRNYISYNSCLALTSNEDEKKRIKLYYLNFLRNNLNIKNFISYILKIFEFKIAPFIKTKPKNFSPFRYKLSNIMNDKNVKRLLEKYKNNKKKILISVLWDEGKKFEILNDRLKGGPVFKEGLEQDFQKLLKFIKKIDENILNGENFQFILASKKAVDWDKIIKSEFIDLRNFEELNISLSQMIYICQELSNYTINWPSTFSIWITNCSNIEHITFHDFKDTAKWCRKNLNNEDLKFF